MFPVCISNVHPVVQSLTLAEPSEDTMAVLLAIAEVKSAAWSASGHTFGPQIRRKLGVGPHER